MHILSLDVLKKSVQSVQISSDWVFSPKFTSLIDWDGDEILKTIKYKIEHNLELTDRDAYLISVIPFTKHEIGNVELIIELCHFVTEIELSEERKYIIKLCQLLWIEVLIKNPVLKNEFRQVVKMNSSYLGAYEKELIETAVNDANEQKDLDHALKMYEKNYPPDDILEITGVDVLNL